MSGKAHKEVQTVYDYIEKSLLLFKGDPPDTEYQRGYQAALAAAVVEVAWDKMLVSQECVEFASAIYYGPKQGVEH